MDFVTNVKFKFLVTGLISGFLSAYFVRVNFFELDLFVAPGIIFGIATLVLFLILKNKGGSWFMKIIWIFGSTLAYFLAVICTLFFHTSTGPSWGGEIPSGVFVLAGMLGALIMLFFFHFAFFKIKPAQFVLLMFLGGALGLSMLLNTGFFNGPGFDLSIFPIWQGGMAFALGFVIDINSKKLENLSNLS